MVSRVLILWDFFLGAPMIRYWSSHGHRLWDMWQMWLYMSDRFNSLWNKSLTCFLLRESCYAVIIYVFQPNQNNNISLWEWIKVFKRFSGVQKRRTCPPLVGKPLDFWHLKMDDLITCAVFEQQNCLHTDAPDYFLDRILRIQPDLRKGIYKMNFGSKIFESQTCLWANWQIVVFYFSRQALAPTIFA